MISGLSTRIVVPLRNLAKISALELPADLFPIIAVDGENHFLDTPQIGAIPLNEFRVKVGSALAQQFDIQTALDRVIGRY